ncbi:MFS transporter [Brevibacillus dissolubilis]|uniref:MFS transporter n=1 Tax=Brevibacillus dissolubilis TaxID=1844116 RepID=UPI0021002BED|nr:MFS transporter [Brevibacillus dissolubilis]
MLSLFIISLLIPIGQPLIYATVIFFATCDLFAAPAYITLMPALVKKEELTEANAMETTIVETIRVLAPFLGTVVYSIAGLGMILPVHAVCSFLCVGATLFMRVDTTPVRHSKTPSILREIREGLTVFQKDIRVTSLVLNGVLTHIFLFPFALIGFPYMIKQVFGGTDIDFGIVESVQTVGSLCSIFGVTFLLKRYNLSQNIFIGIFALNLAVVPMMFLGHSGTLLLLKGSPVFMLFYFSAISFLLFLTFNTYGVFFRTFYQTTVESAMMGRFVSVMVMVFALGRLLGFQLYGALFDHMPLVYAVAVVGVGMLLKMLMHIPFMRHDKKLRENSVPTAEMVGQK